VKWISQHALELGISLLAIAAMTVLASVAASLLSEASRNLLFDIMGGSGALLLGLAAIWGLTTWKKKAGRDLARSFLRSTLASMDALKAASRQGEKSADTYVHLVEGSLYSAAGNKAVIQHEAVQLTNQVDRLGSASREWEAIFAEIDISLGIHIEDSIKSLRCKFDDLVERLKCLTNDISLLNFTSFSSQQAKNEAVAAKRAVAGEFQNIPKEMEADLRKIIDALAPHLQL